MAPKPLHKFAATPSYRAARWFFRDCVRRYRGLLALITVLGAGSAGLLGASLALLNAAISGSGGTAAFDLPLPGLDLHPSVPAVAVLIIVALILSAVLTYAQGRAVFHLWRSYQIHSVNRLLDGARNAVARGVDPAVIDESPVLAGMRQSQRLGAFTRLVASSITPALRFLVFGGIAVALNPVLTVVLFLVTAPSAGLALMYYARKASRSARRVAALSRDAGRELGERLRQALEGDETARVSTSGAVPSPFAEKARAVTDRLLYVEQAKLATGFIAIASLGIFIGYGLTTAPEGEVAWGSMFVYVIALLLAFRQLVMVSSSISGFGRFYPFVQAQRDLVEALEQASSTEDFQERIRRSSIKVAMAADDDLLEDEL